MNAEQNEVANNEETDKIVSRISEKTSIPLGFAIGIVVALIGAAFWMGNLANAINGILANDSPSRTEFNSMCKQLSDIQSGVNAINQYLITNKNK